eukprot:CAMPEP_0181211330 /NCGR_PEP_ID=MMETSP1096-20121128/23724_1 /TAXON_ID=156174 ORGANISM="Chrysochromulina ericina, Strain CCMP281" /NCGR_SAMPLE_ID=MMETSP1096 /ASSEMBLY_ACC=CAM_ASM_000453 /LENGTH=119 /DNA_ID=CAMNT_0023302715 /DNA_START=271 /DNA_END=628 /DNA_ORIENTATION=+
MPNSHDVRIKPKWAARQPKGPHITAATPPGITCARSDAFAVPGPSTAAHTPPVDSIATRISAASRTPAVSTWWFSASCRGLRVDLERSAASSSLPSTVAVSRISTFLAKRLALLDPAGN